MPELTNIDRFLVYILIPFIGIYSLIGHRYYERLEAKRKQSIRISKDLIIGNFISPLVALLSILGIYLYLINFSFISSIFWEISTLLIITMLFALICIGIGAHIASVTIEKTLPQDINKHTRKTTHYFHYPFSHYLTIPTFFLTVHILALYDMYQGKELHLGTLGNGLTILSGIFIGLVISFNTLYHRMDKTISISTGILSLTFLAVTIGENRHLTRHPFAMFIFTSIASTFILLALVNKGPQLIRNQLKHATQKWLGKQIRRKPQTF